MITPKQRKRLEDLAEYHAMTGDQYLFILGAECLDLILGETSESDEEAAKEYVREGDCWLDDAYAAHEETFLAGCARYRPIVEEMQHALNEVLLDLRTLKDSQLHRDTLSVIQKALARAEKLLSYPKGQDE